MLWRVTICLIFLFYYTCNGQIMMVPIQEQMASQPSKLKQKLNVELKGTNGSIKALKAKMPYEYIELPSQWAVHEPKSLYHWPVGEIRYYIDDGSYGKDVDNLLRKAFRSIGFAVDFECPNFVLLDQKPVDGDWLHFTNPDRVRPCVHEPGISQGGEIKIVLGYDCLKPRDVLHTVLHGLGFRDEVTHPKRDLFVRVMWENIQPAFRFMFRIHQSITSNDLSEYDPMSVMHFHDRAYSVNGQATIMSVLPGLKIEPSDQLSHLDKLKIRRIFGNECKKLQIGNILDTCGRNNNIDVDGNYNNENNAGPCFNGGGGGDQIVVHGNDVKLGGGGHNGGLIIPGHDVQINDGNDDQLVVVGNDVHADKNGDEGAANHDDDLSYSNELQSAPKGMLWDATFNETIIVGHHAENNSQLSNSNHDDDLSYSNELQSAPKGMLWDATFNETIVVGHHAENNNQLSNFKKYKQQKLFNVVGNEAGEFVVPDDEAIIVGYGAYGNKKATEATP